MKNKDIEEYYLGAWNNKEMTGQGVLYRPGKVAYYG